MRWCSSADFHGSANAITWAVSIAVISAVALFFTDGLSGILLLYLAVLPVALLLFGLRLRHQDDMPVALYTEMFLTGCVLSIGLATILEGLAQTQTLSVWQCERSPLFTWQCDVLFIIVVTIAVGLSEEVAKFAPLSRIRRGRRYLPESWWFRIAETPYAVCLCGCAAAGGFACVENIKYTLRTGREDLEYGIDTSIFRAVLAIPFHVACTGYAAALFGKRDFIIPRCSAEMDERPKSWISQLLRSAWRRARRETIGAPPVPAMDALPSASLNYSLLSGEEAGELPVEDRLQSASSGATMVYRPMGIWKIMSLLALPALCHGFYDSGLFLAAQFMTAGATADKKRGAISRTFKLDIEEQYSMMAGLRHLGANAHLMTTNSPLLAHVEELLDLFTSNSKAGLNDPHDLCQSSQLPGFEEDPRAALKTAVDEANMYYTLGTFSLAVALGSYLVILSLFLKEWKALGQFQRRAVPMLHEHYDIPM